MNNFAFLDLGTPDLLILLFGMVFTLAIVWIVRTAYRGFMRGYLEKK